MPTAERSPSITTKEILAGWASILRGNIPLLSIEITRECPLSCPGCYAYGSEHLGGAITLSELRDFRGEQLVRGVLDLVAKHKPLHVSLVGGEPLVRHRELSLIIPALNELGVFTMVVTSGVIPIPIEWMSIPRFRLAVSVDGLPEHHDIRRKPATYQRILKNIDGRKANIHWVITRPMLERTGYLEEYVSFWSGRPEVDHIWVSVYTPQIGETSPETLTLADRAFLAQALPVLSSKYPKFLMNKGIAQAILHPPRNPDDCVFSKMSVNYSADLESRVEPCVFGGTPDCSQCGCAISSALHWVKSVNVAGPLRVGHLIGTSIRIGRIANRFRSTEVTPSRWEPAAADSLPSKQESDLVQIDDR